jgi:integrase
MPMREVCCEHVQAFLDVFADKAAQQTNGKVVMQSMQQWAIPRGYLKVPFTIGLQVERSKGHRPPWLDHHVETAIKHARPDLARFVVLAAYTGQRISDLVKMRWRHVRTERGFRGIQVVQTKTGKVLWIPLVDDLLPYIDAWEHEYKSQPRVDLNNDFIVLKRDGTPWNEHLLTEHWNRHRKVNPALAEHEALQLSFHGLRATAVIRLKQLNVSTDLICSFVGMSRQIVSVYTAMSDQIENSIAAMEAMNSKPKTAQIVPLHRIEKD